jgi:hypothetical protein
MIDSWKNIRSFFIFPALRKNVVSYYKHSDNDIFSLFNSKNYAYTHNFLN